MVRTTKSIDVSDLPEVRRLAEEVRAAGEPYLLRSGTDEVAILLPIAESERSGRGDRTEADYDAFLSSFGGWKGIVDTEELKAGIRAGRSSDRPPVDL